MNSLDLYQTNDVQISRGHIDPHDKKNLKDLQEHGLEHFLTFKYFDTEKELCELRSIVLSLFRSERGNVGLEDIISEIQMTTLEDLSPVVHAVFLLHNGFSMKWDSQDLTSEYEDEFCDIESDLLMECSILGGYWGWERDYHLTKDNLLRHASPSTGLLLALTAIGVEVVDYCDMLGLGFDTDMGDYVIGNSNNVLLPQFGMKDDDIYAVSYTKFADEMIVNIDRSLCYEYVTQDKKLEE